MTNISWTTETWNPIVGCSIVSKGCTNCYAMRMAHRLGANPKTPHYRGLTMKVNGNPVWNHRIAAAPDHVWQQPLRRRKPTTWFVNSMGDLFHEAVPDEMIDRAFAIMALCPQHTFQCLSKWPERMRTYIRRQCDRGRWPAMDLAAVMAATGQWDTPALDLRNGWPLQNVWLGTSVEDQATAAARIPPLLGTPAALRFISAEPLLGPVDLTLDGLVCLPCRNAADGLTMDPTTGAYECCPRCDFTGIGDEWAIDWVVCGGESGPGARPMHPAWARSLRDQCAAAGIPYHFKQWGEWLPDFEEPGEGFDDDPEQSRFRTCVWEPDNSAWGETNGSWCDSDQWYFADNYQDPEQAMTRVGKKTAGRYLDGVIHDAMPPHAGGAA